MAKGGQRWQPRLEKLLKGGVEPPLHMQNTFKEELLDVDEVPTVLVVNPASQIVLEEAEKTLLL